MDWETWAGGFGGTLMTKRLNLNPSLKNPKPWGKCSRGCFGNHERLSHTSDGLFKSILSAIVDELRHTYLPPGDAAHPRMSPLMHDAATGMVLHEINVYT